MGKKSSKLHTDVIADLTERTSFSKSELKRWYKIYCKHSNGGNLKLESFKKIYGQHFSGGDPSKLAKHMFRNFDINGDETIDFSEFIISLHMTSHGTLEQKLEWVFSLYDVDKNGRITRDEMKEILSSITEMIGGVNKRRQNSSDTLIDRIFEQMDTDNDGELSLSEFLEGSKNAPCYAEMLQCDSRSFKRNLLRKSGR